MKNSNFTEDGKRIFKNEGFIQEFYVAEEGGDSTDPWASREDYIYGRAHRIPISYVLWANFRKLDKWKNYKGELQEEYKTKRVRLGEINNFKEHFTSYNSKVASALDKTNEIVMYILDNTEKYINTGITLYKEMVDNNSRIAGEHPEWTIDKNEADGLITLFMAVFDVVYDKNFTGNFIDSINAKDWGKILLEKIQEIEKEKNCES